MLTHGMGSTPPPPQNVGWLGLGNATSSYSVWQEVSSTAGRAVYKSYVRPAILYGSEAWCQKEEDCNLVKDREIHDERTM